nr:MAG TPA: hypothetical protein [Caudoviricetes sp.]
MTEEIIIDGVKYFKQSDINKGLDEEHYVIEFHLLATHYNILLEDYARKYNSLKEQLKRKEQECEKLKAIVTEAEEAPICFHCSEEPCIRQERDKYKQALEEIESLCKNEACAPCKELEENDHCDECHGKIILDIINKEKDGK